MAACSASGNERQGVMTEKTYTIRKLRWTTDIGEWVAPRSADAPGRWTGGFTTSGLNYHRYRIIKPMKRGMAWILRHSHDTMRIQSKDAFFDTKAEAQAATQAHFEASLKYYLKIAK